MTQEIEKVQAPPSQSPHAVLPSFGNQFGSALKQMIVRFDLPIFLALPLVLFPIMEYLGEVFEGNAALAAVQPILSILALVGFVLMLICSRYVVSLSPLRKVPLREAFSWLFKGGLGYLWVFLLAALALLGGLTLLIIPGLLVFAYLHFSVFGYVREDKRGIKVLVRSYELAQGNYWGILVRRLTLIVGTVLLFCVPSTIVLLFLGNPVTPATVSNALLAGFDSALLELITEMITMLGLTSMITVGLFVAQSIYESLSGSTSTNNVNVTDSDKAKQRFTLLSILGLISLVAIIIFTNSN